MGRSKRARQVRPARWAHWFWRETAPPAPGSRPSGPPPAFPPAVAGAGAFRAPVGEWVEKPGRVPEELLRADGGGGHHLELAAKSFGREVAFWGALGWRRDHQKHRGVAYPGEWLTSRYGEPRLWLRLDWSALVPEIGGLSPITLCLVGWMDERLADVERLPFDVEGEELTRYWGARRVGLTSPSGWKVDLLERVPSARRYGPPE